MNLAMPLRRKPFRDLASSNDISLLTKTPLDRLLWIVKNRVGLYGRFTRPKKKGGVRVITPPCKELRGIQYRIKEYVDQEVRWPLYLHGGIEGRSVITNAAAHVGQRVVANFDIEGFFPSTSEDRVAGLFQDGGMAGEAAELAAALCCFEGRLPQGAPTSTCLANLAFSPIDDRLLKIIRRRRFAYTRFVDDLTISGGEDVRSFKGTVKQEIQRGGYTTSLDVLLGRHQRQVVTGIVVNDRMRPSAEFIQQLKGDVRDCWPDGVGVEAVAAYYGMTIPQLRNKLFGRISHLKRFDVKIARAIRGLMAKIVWRESCLSPCRIPASDGRSGRR